MKTKDEEIRVLLWMTHNMLAHLYDFYSKGVLYDSVRARVWLLARTLLYEMTEEEIKDFIDNSPDL